MVWLWLVPYLYMVHFVLRVLWQMLDILSQRTIIFMSFEILFMFWFHELWLRFSRKFHFDTMKNMQNKFFPLPLCSSSLFSWSDKATNELLDGSQFQEFPLQFSQQNFWNLRLSFFLLLFLKNIKNTFIHFQTDFSLSRLFSEL